MQRIGQSTARAVRQGSIILDLLRFDDLSVVALLCDLKMCFCFIFIGSLPPLIPLLNFHFETPTLFPSALPLLLSTPAPQRNQSLRDHKGGLLSNLAGQTNRLVTLMNHQWFYTLEYR